MRDPIETIMYRNSEIAIYQDEDTFETPNDWDTENMCLVYDHRDFCSYPVLHGTKLDSGWAMAIFDEWNAGKKTIEFGGTRYWMFPVFAYIHGDVVLYLSRREANQWEPSGFDTSFKGFALVSRQYPIHLAREDAIKSALRLIKTWNQYLSGEVYGYQSPSGSCWGYYGEEGKADMIETAKAEIDHDCNQRLLKKIEKVKTFIRNKVPLEVRARRIPIIH